MMTFRVVLREYVELCRLWSQIESQASQKLADPDFRRLQSIPGIGPILALLILA